MEQLSFQSFSVLNWLFESTIYISILICMIFIIKAFMKGKLPAWWSYCLWLLLLFRMIIPWGIETPASVFNYIPAPPEDDSYMAYLEEHKIYIPFIQNASDVLPAAIPTDTDLSKRPFNDRHDNHDGVVTNLSDYNITFDKALLVLWISGVLAFGIATVYKNSKFWLIIRREQPVTDTDVLDLFNECRSILGIRKKVEIIVTDSVKSPAIFGYVKPQLLLPPQFIDTLKKEELNCVFLHELGHLKRHDIGVSLLVTLFQVIYWFNPLVWYAFHHLRADQEAACDAYVLSKTKQVRPTDYARTIVNLLERFVQNRQLPSLAGIIENKSKIDKRITMILEYKRITLKRSFISVLMLLIMSCAFFSFSTGRLTARESSDSSIIQPEYFDMKHYESSDWSFALDIPKRWNSFPPVSTNSPNEVIRFISNEAGNHILIIFRNPYDPKKSLDEIRDQTQQVLVGGGFGNFATSETTIGSRKVLTLDFDKTQGNGIWRCRHYFVAEGTLMYVLGFGTTDKTGKFELFDRMAKTFEIIEEPIALDMKHYESSNWNFALDIPKDWNASPPVPSNSPYEVIRFISNEDGNHNLIIFRNPYDSKKSLDEIRDQTQQVLAGGGFGNFAASETTVGSRKVLMLDFDKSLGGGIWNCRHYFFAEGTLMYVLGFGTTNKTGKFELYDRMAKSFEILAEPSSLQPDLSTRLNE